jgi:hypothetical protein
MRTDPGVPIDRLFDHDLGPLGEVGYLWQAVRRWGPGVVLPRPMMELAGRAEPADESSLKFLVENQKVLPVLFLTGHSIQPANGVEEIRNRSWKTLEEIKKLCTTSAK